MNKRISDPRILRTVEKHAYCFNCEKETMTALINLSSGHVGNCCSICRATRKGKPFAGKLDRAKFKAELGEL